MASPNISTEVSARHSYELQTSIGWPAVEVIRFEDAATQGYYSVNKKERRFRLHYENITTAQVAELETFLAARIGSYATFYFNRGEPVENDIPVKLDGELRTSLKSVGVFDADIEVQETV